MWHGPTVEGLIDELEHAVGSAPDQFIYVLPEFLEAPRDYQYGLINGFLKLWRNPKEDASPIDWDEVWRQLFVFFKRLLQDQRLWEIDGVKPGWARPSWVSNVIADLLIEGTRDDKRAYPSVLLPSGWDLIRILVKRGDRIAVMERLMLGYLWEEESLESSRFSYLFKSARPEDFQWIHMFFRSIRGEALKPEQVERIVAYWRYCVTWAEQQADRPTWLLSGLSVLTSFLTTAEGCRDLLLAVAPHVSVHHEIYEFIRELNRLVEESPAEVRDTLASFIETHQPFYDYEGRMRALIARLAELEYREDAIRFCEKLRSMAGMETLFNELTLTA